MHEMPKMQFDKFLELVVERQITKHIPVLKKIVADDWSIRKSTPTPKNPDEGKARYVWRMVAFAVSPNPRHHCMPYGADLYLEYSDFEQRRKLVEELDLVVDAIIDSIETSSWHGIARWKGLI